MEDEVRESGEKRKGPADDDDEAVDNRFGGVSMHLMSISSIRYVGIMTLCLQQCPMVLMLFVTCRVQ